MTVATGSQRPTARSLRYGDAQLYGSATGGHIDRPHRRDGGHAQRPRLLARRLRRCRVPLRRRPALRLGDRRPPRTTWSPLPRPRTVTGTGSSPPAVACSAMATPISTARSPPQSGTTRSSRSLLLRTAGATGFFLRVRVPSGCRLRARASSPAMSPRSATRSCSTRSPTSRPTSRGSTSRRRSAGNGTKASRSLSSSSREDRLGAIVIIDLGTNGPVTPEQFTTMMDVLAGASRVVFVTVHLPPSYSWWQSVNDTLRQGVAEVPARPSGRLQQAGRREPAVVRARRRSTCRSAARELRPWRNSSSPKPEPTLAMPRWHEHARRRSVFASPARGTRGCAATAFAARKSGHSLRCAR